MADGKRNRLARLAGRKNHTNDREIPVRAALIYATYISLANWAAIAV
jgi:hypothetical protein